MLTTEDIQKLIAAQKEVFTTKEDLIPLKSDIREIKEDVSGLRESLQGMIVATDNLTKVITDLHMEYTAITYQLKRHEDWIRQIAAKAGVSLTS